ncbi:permease [Tuwongella immobilis]|uniref:Permease n=1 Tax=Tuwongella immobilis TaxID=692036 RepID=A0A6C2YWL9_9BACT|nr:permease [Tuwongella immobilis]VIP05757.1 Uncharacterized protein OS=Planctomyces maris DSM 8797 GN=PM8797T_23094 PE=4 SV=1: DUF318 [Tuwongella immobilis]VTS08870.1 Uncharacterized protein OS=Planctomyces maris DSM 8797 GN=PM8797T_23094 PE=4 SV=1: DUF318 [Tuwongella immobilis]
MVESILWSVGLRTTQVAVEASMTLLCGLIIAGVMRRMLGVEGIRNLFGANGSNGLFRAWAVGLVLPVCSVGVIPIAYEMRRAGVRSGTILAYVLAAPHVNPLSLLYGLTLSEPQVIICYAIASLLLALGAGYLWDRYFDRSSDYPATLQEPMPAPGPKRLLAVLTTAGQQAIHPMMGFAIIGVLFTGLLSGLLPHGCLSLTMRHDDPISPTLMTLISMPLYSGPLQGMMRIGLMFEHGNSVGAGFSLFELGIGVNIGLICWLAMMFGWKRVLIWFAILAIATLGIGYAMENPLYFAHEEATHTHAFDDWTSPFDTSFVPNWEFIRGKLKDKAGALELVSLAVMGSLMLLGGLLRLVDPQRRLDAWLTKAPPAGEVIASKYDLILPKSVLIAVSIAGLLIFSAIATYTFYPAVNEAFEQIAMVRTEAISAVRTGNREEGIRQLEHWDLLTRKLQVGQMIRTFRYDAEAAKITNDLRELIEEVRDELRADKLDEARKLLPQVEAAHRAVRAVYLGDAGTPPAPVLPTTPASE